MTAQETNVANAVRTTLSGSMGPTATSFTVASASGVPAVPFYVVIDPLDADLVEVILVDQSVAGTTLTASSLTKRYLDGSASPSGLTHASGAVVYVGSVVAQLIRDIHDRIDLSYYAGMAADIPVSEGGTGASNASGARTNLGLVIDTHVASVTALDAEAATRSAADVAIDARVDVLELTGGGSVASEAAIRSAADIALDGRLDVVEAGYAQGTLTSGYVAVTANQTGIGTGQTDLTSLTRTVTTVAGRRYRVSARTEFIVGATATVTEVRLLADGTVIDRADITLNGAQGRQALLCAIVSPSAAAHVYKLAALSDAGTTTMVALSTAPCWIMVEDIGV